MIKQEQDQIPLKIVIEQVEEILMILTRSKTKAMTKAEVIQPDMPCATTNLATKMVSTPATPKIQGAVRPGRSILIKWAYGTGIANQEEDDYNANKMC
jgi:hypothetical protein